MPAVRELPMTLKLGGSALVIILVILFIQACFFSGGDTSTPSVARPSSIPTATPPAQLPEPVLLGETQAAAPAASSGDTYVVKSGDTLGGIASQLGIPVDQQAAWVAEVLRLNGIADARLLASGVALRLPRSPTPAATARATATSPAATATRPAATPTAQTAAPTPTPQLASPTPTPRPTVVGGGGTYTVVSGDNPHLIGQKYCVPTAQLDAWANQLLALNNTTASGLQVGQVLQLPANTPGCGTSPPQ